MHIQFKTKGGTVVTLPENAMGLRKAESVVRGNKVTRYFVDVLGSDVTCEIPWDEYDKITFIMEHAPEGGVVRTSDIAGKEGDTKQ